MLTAKQEAFCQHFAAHRVGADAYRHAYAAENTSGQTAAQEASKLLAHRKISERIKELQVELYRSSPVAMDLAAAFSHWVRLATADRNELIKVKVGCCRHCHGVGFGYQWREREYLEALDEYEHAVAQGDTKARLPEIKGGFGFDHTLEPVPECTECRGEGVNRIVPQDTTKLSETGRMLYGGVKMTKYGPEIVMVDPAKAMENVTRMLGGFKDTVRLDGSLTALNTVLTTKDPEEASRLYRELVARVAI